jgi:DNA-binding NarL/FixJ family response regulator
MNNLIGAARVWRDTTSSRSCGNGEQAKVPEKRIRVLLVDDHRLFRGELADLLSDDALVEVVGQAADGQEALELARDVKPDVVLMDVTMPRMDGLEATARIVKVLPRTRVIGLSMHEEADMAPAMCKAGAVAYFRKDCNPMRLLEEIHARRG